MTKTFSLIALILIVATSARADITFLPSALRPQINLPTAAPGPGPSVVNVLDYVRNHITHNTIDQLDKINTGYNRRDNFGGWITNNSGCLDTRGQVLVRADDPSTPVSYKDSRNCTVVKGLWHDPYAANDYKLAKAIQIDHVVPLKHVYLTGGKDWAPSKRCYYANFTHNDFHLLAVAGHENMAKGDKAPDQYMPPNDSFQCQYVANWMKVKTIWQLVTTEAELNEIQDVIQTHHCDMSKLEYAESDLDGQRAAIDNSIPSRCVDFGNQSAQLELPFNR